MMDTDRSLEPANMEDAIFETAIHIDDPGQRRAFLKRSFHGDPEGLARMSDLLEIAGESAAFFIETRKHRGVLAEDVLDGLEPDLLRKEETPRAFEDQPDKVIDRYRVIRRIGAGGCGVVYEAEQQEPVRRKVALKVIRLGMNTEMVISRFEAERQALALMDHPNIARVLDAGTTGDRPYFVMELVKGERITSYCDAERLDVPGRLELFIQVCHAIQHAHQKGIIHRDIKPSNILVATHDEIAMPKIIDFGIAKATGGRPGGAGWTESLEHPVGTPAYMSPEQVDMGGIDIDTRGDIYSLGALLYELLAGQPPFDGDALIKSGMSEMRRTLLEKNPPLPSTCLSAAGGEAAGIAARRRCDKKRLVSLLKGDLDWIVMKAMEKDRNRRYQTANSLAMDVQRFLADEPVIARRPGRLYLFGKFIRRNRAVCLSGLLVFVSLFGGLGAATTLYLRERTALREKERLRLEAEEARTEEARLRYQAQARANVSRVAVLLSEGLVEEADALLQENPLEFIEPSREAADVFRSLGNWNAIYGRWEQAARCFTLLNQANRLEPRAQIVEGFDLLIIAPPYVEHGDIAGYEAFRRDAMDLYLPARTSLEAEHLLKVCLLTPAGRTILRRLEPAAELCAGGIPGSTVNALHPEWNAFSLALYHHRLGNPEKVLEWCRISSEYPDDAGARTASLLCLAAMAHRQTGGSEQALENLRKAAEMIPPPSNPNHELQAPMPGYWFSWSVARILLREASAP